MTKREMTTLLAQINKIRLAFDNQTISEMPKGIVSSPKSCPIAMSLNNGVRVEVAFDKIEFTLPGRRSKATDAEAKRIAARLKASGFSGIYTDGEWGMAKFISIHMTTVMYKFVTQFDEKKIPELIRGISRL